MHIGFNYREGTVISDIRYEGRKLFHRLSISDMVSRLSTNCCSAQHLMRTTLSKTVPYGDPRVSSRCSRVFGFGKTRLEHRIIRHPSIVNKLLISVVSLI